MRSGGFSESLEALRRRSYRRLFLVQNRAYWHACPFPFDKSQDLVLTHDFGVYQELRNAGGNCAFLDHLTDSVVMERYNHETYAFFSRWHKDSDGKDIFSYRGVDVGNAFRIVVWSNITGYVRTLVNLLALKKMDYRELCLGSDDENVSKGLCALNLDAKTWTPSADHRLPEYYFPIYRWVDERIYPSGAVAGCKAILSILRDILWRIGESLGLVRKDGPNLYIHRYHPTVPIVEQLQERSDLSLCFESYSWGKKSFKERRIPAWGLGGRYRQRAGEMLGAFPQKRSAEWDIEGIPVSDHLYAIILRRIEGVVADCLQRLDGIHRYLRRRKLDLMVTISNIGVMNCLMLNYCHHRGIPTYLIINGLLTNAYLDEGKEARWINAYGESIRENYFRGMDNIVCLGDPRMDAYATARKSRSLNREAPSILIGASGFNNIDLNSYVAVEFDFLHDVLTTCQVLIRSGRRMTLGVKIRSNGYREQYEAFLQEYFPDLGVEIHDQVPMKEILMATDFYISIYSQTLFEASALGIPAIYYKKDTEILMPPFDGQSELVTAFSLEELAEKVEMFYRGEPLYESFQQKVVMERYIGPLDGGNLKRNVDFIDRLMEDGRGSVRTTP